MGVSGAVLLSQGLRVPTRKILIVDDDPLVTTGLEKTVTEEGFSVATANTGSKALQSIEDDPPDIILLDIKLPDSMDGLALLEAVKQTRPEIAVIVISGQAEIRSAVDAMKAGASDYMEKPIDSHRLKALLEPFRAMNLPESKSPVMADFVFESDRMKRVVEIMQRLALKSDITVLVLGESGTGKNYLCRKMHDLSPRKGFAYVQVGCASVPDHLIESELFGYEKGAFTDAKQSKKGLVEVAEGGTLLLDELGEMPYPFQAKVLALLEEKRFRKVGALQDSFADIRILAATNRNLHTLVQEKKFRLDLYYRLNVATIEMPPLRERVEDIPLLARHFLTLFSRKYGEPPQIMEEEGVKLLQEYHWPGNIRQLKNLLERLVILTDRKIISTQEISSGLMLQPQIGTDADLRDSQPLSGSLSLVAMEEHYIRTALKLTAGNQRQAAALLHVSRDTLRYRLKKMGLREQ